jgi:hypothetical protein
MCFGKPARYLPRFGFQSRVLLHIEEGVRGQGLVVSQNKTAPELANT